MRGITDGDAYLRDIASGCEVVGLAQPGGITDVAIRPTSMKIATAGTDGAGRVWDITAQEQPRPITACDADCSC